MLGGFAFQNLQQKVNIRFLYWTFNEIPLIAVISTAFVSGILIRYLAVFTDSMDKRRIEKARIKIIETQEADARPESNEKEDKPALQGEKEGE
ncbi:MAG: LapA family protein [Pseudomonadota bacterium]